MQLSPALTKCPQCGSDGCGPMRCRFSLIEHEDFKRIAKRIRRAARATKEGAQLKIDHQQRKAYKAVAQQLGFSVSFFTGKHCLLMTAQEES